MLVKTLIFSGVLGIASLAAVNSTIGESSKASVTGKNSMEILDASRNRTTTTTTTTTRTTTRTGGSRLEQSML